MHKIAYIVYFFTIALVLAACNSSDDEETGSSDKTTLTLGGLPDNNNRIDKNLVCIANGGNSDLPTITWQANGGNIAKYALLLVGGEGGNSNTTRWMTINIAKQTTSLRVDATHDGETEVPYQPPCLDAGKNGEYTLTLFALSKSISMEEARKRAIVNAGNGAKEQFTTLYKDEIITEKSITFTHSTGSFSLAAAKIGDETTDETTIQLADKHSCSQNISPYIRWQNPPAGTQSFAILMDSTPDNQLAWQVFGMSKDTFWVDENADFSFATQTQKYNACPKERTYSITVYALKSDYTPDAATPRAAFEQDKSNDIAGRFTITAQPATIVTLPPATPTGLALDASTASSLTLSWNTVTGVTYKVFYSKNTPVTTADMSQTGAPPITIGGLSADTTYYIAVQAIKGDLSSDLSQQQAFTTTAQSPPQPPATPTGLRVDTSTDNRLTLSWNTVADATSYRVFYSTRDPVSIADASKDSNTNAITLDNLTANTSYYIAVQAIKGDLSSDLSQQQTFTTTAQSSQQPPATPTGLRVDASTDNSLTLSWTAVAGAGVTYKVFYSKNTPVTTADMSQTGAPPLTIRDLSADTTYYVAVQAIKGDLSSDLSDPSLQASTKASTPSAPFTLTSASFTDDNGVIPAKHAGWSSTSPPLTWSGAPAETLSFVIIMEDNSIGFSHWIVRNIPASTTQIAEGETFLSPSVVELGYQGPSPPPTGHIYTITVYALNVASIVGPINFTSFTTDHKDNILANSSISGRYPAPLLAKPTGIVVEASTDSSLTLRWDLLTDATGYTVYYLDANIFHASSWPSVTTITNSVTLDNLTSGATYKIKVRGTDNSRPMDYGGLGEESDEVQFTVPQPPATPTGLRVDASTDNSLTLSWNTVTGVTYKVFYSKNTPVTTADMSQTGAPPLTIGGLSADTSYYIAVQAIKGDLSSDLSDPSLQASTKASTPSAPFTLTSPSFIDGNGVISVKHANNPRSHGAENKSPALTWANPPAGTQSFVIIMEDVHNSGNLLHWYVRNIPAATTRIAEEASFSSPSEVDEDYDGPAPPLTGHTYTITVYALNVASIGFTNPSNFTTDYKDNILASSSISGRYPAPLLAKPTGIVVEASTDSSLTLRWDLLTDATGYTVYYLDANIFHASSWPSVTTITNSVTLDNLTSGATYKIKVRGTDNSRPMDYGGLGEESDEVQFTVPQPPATPTGLRVDASTDNRLTLSWNTVADATGYRVFYSTRDPVSIADASKDSNTNAITLDNLTANTSYYIAVQAIKGNLSSDLSQQQVFTTPQSPPATPTGLRVDASTDNRLTLSWNTVTGVTYKVFYSKNTPVTTADMSQTGAPPLTIRDLSADTPYYIAVQAIKGDLSSVLSSQIAASTKAATSSGPFTLMTTSFTDGGSIPAKHAVSLTGAGAGISPQLSWSNAPSGTQAFAIIMDDEVAPCGTGTQACVHWGVFNIPSATTNVSEGGTFGAGVTITSNWGAEAPDQFPPGFSTSGYVGPSPPFGTHTYTITVYALRNTVTVQTADVIRRAGFVNQQGDNILDSASITGTFDSSNPTQ